MIENKPRRALPLILLGLGLVFIVVSAYFAFQNLEPQSDLVAVPALVNYSAPELTLNDIQGVTRSLADYRGRVVLVNLWATWCPPCKEEMPTLQAFYDKYSQRGFTIIAINDGDPIENVLQFVKDNRLSFPVWLDPKYAATDVAFKTLNLPSSYVIDRTGMIRLMWVGGINSRMLQKHVVPIIMEKQ